MEYYGIKIEGDLNRIGYIAHTKHGAWQNFFRDYAHKLPLEEAIRAYNSIGYECVQLDVFESGKGPEGR